MLSIGAAHWNLFQHDLWFQHLKVVHNEEYYVVVRRVHISYLRPAAQAKSCKTWGSDFMAFHLVMLRNSARSALYARQMPRSPASPCSNPRKRKSLWEGVNWILLTCDTPHMGNSSTPVTTWITLRNFMSSFLLKRSLLLMLLKLCRLTFSRYFIPTTGANL